MSRFFWRILLSTWVVVAATTAVSLWVATLMPASDPTVASGHRMDRLVALVARDLRAVVDGGCLGQMRLAACPAQRAPSHLPITRVRMRADR